MKSCFLVLGCLASILLRRIGRILGALSRRTVPRRLYKAKKMTAACKNGKPFAISMNFFSASLFPGFLSGCHFNDKFLYAFLISFVEADRETPKI